MLKASSGKILVPKADSSLPNVAQKLESASDVCNESHSSPAGKPKLLGSKVSASSHDGNTSHVCYGNLCSLGASGVQNTREFTKSPEQLCPQPAHAAVNGSNLSTTFPEGSGQVEVGLCRARAPKVWQLGNRITKTQLWSAERRSYQCCVPPLCC